jgi:hypothetical protein
MAAMSLMEPASTSVKRCAHQQHPEAVLSDMESVPTVMAQSLQIACVAGLSQGLHASLASWHVLCRLQCMHCTLKRHLRDLGLSSECTCCMQVAFELSEADCCCQPAFCPWSRPDAVEKLQI